MELAFILQIAATYSILWAIWRIIRSFVVKTPLDNIPGPIPKSIWAGNLPQLFKLDAWEFHRELAEKFGGIVKITGILGGKHLYVYDPKALHHIVVKDQHIYEETDSFIVNNSIIFGEGLLSTMGDRHRKQRKMLNPVFSTAHMRAMIPIFYGVSNKLRDAFLKKVKNGPQEIEILSWMTRTALELVGQSGLGFSFDPLTEGGVEHPYSTSVKLLMPTNYHFRLEGQFLLPILVKIGTPRFRRFVVDMLPGKYLSRMREIINIMHNTSIEIFESKKKALEEGDEAVSEQIGRGKDIISILLKANMNAAEEERLSDTELIGQISTLTFAAMDTTSSALARTLYLLAENQDVQDKLRQEIREAHKQHGEMTYDQLVGLPYLDAICRETLRLHPPVPNLLRVARQDAFLPISNPIKGIDGEEIKEIFVQKGTSLFISILASNRNPELWGSDSYEWKPERWLSPLPDKVTEAHIPGIYSNLMTFLGGGRACIGFKFSQLEMKVVLCLLLQSFRFSLPNNKKIIWHMIGITSPALEEEKLKPQLPLLVSIAAD